MKLIDAMYMLTVIKTRDELILFCSFSVNTRFTAIHRIFTNVIVQLK